MKLLYFDETEKIIGILYEVYNNLDWGYKEKKYENALIHEAKINDISCTNQIHLPVTYKGKKIGVGYCDLLFYDKIVVELKVGKKMLYKDFKQLEEYLKILKLEVGLLALYSPDGVTHRRVVNPDLVKK
jgi:GxxExxY protein